MSMRFKLTGEGVAINLVVAYGYAPTEANPNTKLKEEYWKKLGHMIEQIPNEGIRANWKEDGRVW